MITDSTGDLKEATGQAVPAQARPVTLFTGQWADLPFEEVCRLAAEWGYDGLEIACWGDHFEVDRYRSVERETVGMRRHRQCIMVRDRRPRQLGMSAQVDRIRLNGRSLRRQRGRGHADERARRKNSGGDFHDSLPGAA